MEKLLTKAVKLGLGVADLTREQVEKFVKDVSKNKDVNTKEGRKLVDDIFKDACDTRKKLEKKIQDQVGMAVKKMPLATKADIARLEKKLDALVKKRK